MNAQLQQLLAKFMALETRERLMVVIGGVVVLLVAIYSLGLAPLYKAVNERDARVTKKQDDLAWMQSVVAQLQSLGAAQPANNNAESLVVVIANTASRANVANALTGQTPNGANSVRVRLEGVQFDALVVWLGALQKEYGIYVEAADISRAGQAGQANAGLTLARGS
jgi:general secretion pathway protein M